MKEQLTLFQEASLVSPLASLESGKARRTNAIFGTKCLEQFKRLSPNSSLQKTSMVSRILTGEWYSSKCALIWKIKGTKYNRLLFQLVPKTLRTEETVWFVAYSKRKGGRRKLQQRQRQRKLRRCNCKTSSNALCKRFSQSEKQGSLEESREKRNELTTRPLCPNWEEFPIESHFVGEMMGFPKGGRHLLS